MADITEHFGRGEFSQPALYGLPLEAYPAELVTSHLLPLCRDVLEVLRAEVQRPLVVIAGGGWRSVEWQRRHGGVAGSRHSHGDAADVRCKGMTGEQLHDLVLLLWNEGRLPALGGLGRYASREFTHVDIRPHALGELARWG